MKAQANRVEVAELRMLRWTCGKTILDMIPNGVFRAELDVDSIIDKMREGRLRWRRGKPKIRWEDRLKKDMKELFLSEDMTSDRNVWRDRIRISRMVKYFKDQWESSNDKDNEDIEDVCDDDIGVASTVTTNVMNDPSNIDLRKEEAKTLKEYCKAFKDEEKFLFQQATAEWLNDEDMNSKFFHVVLKSRANKNIVVIILVEKRGETVSNKDALDIIRLVNDEEIKHAMFDIDDNKAPIKEFFNTGKILKDVNATIISVVPKLDIPSKVSRPIACYNVVFKCISKILTERIKCAICKLVNPNQSAFLPGRQITDNIMLTQELLRGYG
ncbi:hypothetical protein Tco_1349809 [Tanacetum coccineum]